MTERNYKTVALGLDEHTRLNAMAEKMTAEKKRQVSHKEIIREALDLLEDKIKKEKNDER